LVTHTFVQEVAVEKWFNGRQTVMAEFEDENAAGFEMRSGLRDEIGVEFVTFLAAVESNFRFVIADFAHERRCFATPM